MFYLDTDVCLSFSYSDFIHRKVKFLINYCELQKNIHSWMYICEDGSPYIWVLAAYRTNWVKIWAKVYMKETMIHVRNYMSRKIRCRIKANKSYKLVWRGKSFVKGKLCILNEKSIRLNGDTCKPSTWRLEEGKSELGLKSSLKVHTNIFETLDHKYKR